MKKRKTYEISVIDKTYSKTISDETKFYTSDTALELGFELKETEYTFESAEQSRQSAELIRVENENQREIDHANRSAELAGKADKKQEGWITPTLINGWKQNRNYDVVGYYKDDFGVVHLRGSVGGGEAMSNVFILPTGYRPSKYAFYPVLLDPSGDSLGSIYVDSIGGVYSYQTGVSLSLNHISFRSER